MSRLPSPKTPKGAPRPVSNNGLRRLLEVPVHRRTLVMILLAAPAGLGVDEIAKFRGEDVDIDGRALRVTGKGGRTDSIPLHPSAHRHRAHDARTWLVVPRHLRRAGHHVMKVLREKLGAAYGGTGLHTEFRATIPHTQVHNSARAHRWRQGGRRGAPRNHYDRAARAPPVDYRRSRTY